MALCNDVTLQRINKRIRELKERRLRLRKTRYSISRQAKKAQKDILDIVIDACGDAEALLLESEVLVQFHRLKRQLAHLDASLGTIQKNLRKLYAQANEQLDALYNL